MFSATCYPLLQPLDVSVFGPVKSEWKKVLKTYQIETRTSMLTKDFPVVLEHVAFTL